MLFRQSLVGRDQQNVIQRSAIVVQKLAIVEVHDQGFAAARCHPESQFSEIAFLEGGVFDLSGCFVCIPSGDKLIQFVQKLGAMIEVAVEKHLCIKQGEMLKISQSNRLMTP